MWNRNGSRSQIRLKMNKSEIKISLLESHSQFISHLKALSDQDFTRNVNGKWSAGQQLDHIIKSVAPVKMAFSLPKFSLALIFGKANRESKSYEDLVAKYQSKLPKAEKHLVVSFLNLLR